MGPISKIYQPASYTNPAFATMENIQVNIPKRDSEETINKQVSFDNPSFQKTENINENHSNPAIVNEIKEKNKNSRNVEGTIILSCSSSFNLVDNECNRNKEVRYLIKKLFVTYIM